MKLQSIPVLLFLSPVVLGFGLAPVGAQTLPTSGAASRSSVVSLATPSATPSATTSAMPSTITSAASSDVSSDLSWGSPVAEAGGYVYVSGQGPRRADRTVPEGFAAQARQCLDNVKRLLETSGLSIEQVVYVQVYLVDSQQTGELDRVFADYFAGRPPARAVLGVAALPDPPLEITAVAVRDPAGKQPVLVPGWPSSKAYCPGMLTHDRLFVSTMPGAEPASGAVPADPAAQVNLALDRLEAVLRAARLTMAHMVFVNPYLAPDLPARVMNAQYAKRFEFGNTPARATIEVSSLPGGAQIAFTGVAVRDLNARKAIRPKNMAPSPTASPCVFAGDTLYCSAKSGFIPGPNGGIYTPATAEQTRQSMRNLLDNLEEADMNFDQVVSTTIYLDDLGEAPLFWNVYKKYFKSALPAATAVQQLKPGDRKANAEGEYPTLEQLSLIAVRKPARSQ
jgi:enamine deaminase RidA (YjgF/YER057c/UK114 family)